MSNITVLFLILIILIIVCVAVIAAYNHAYKKHVNRRLEQTLKEDSWEDAPKKTMPSATSIALLVVACALLINTISLWGGVQNLQASISALGSHVSNLEDRITYLESQEDPLMIDTWTESIVNEEWQGDDLMLTFEVSILSVGAYCTNSMFLTYGSTTVEMEPDTTTWQNDSESPAFKAEITVPLYNHIEEVYVRTVSDGIDHTEALGWMLCNYVEDYLPNVWADVNASISDTHGKLKFKGSFDIWETSGECGDQLTSVTIGLNIDGETVENWDVSGYSEYSLEIKDSWKLGDSDLWEFWLTTETDGGWSTRQIILASDAQDEQYEELGVTDCRLTVYTDPHGVEHTLDY